MSTRNEERGYEADVRTYPPIKTFGHIDSAMALSLLAMANHFARTKDGTGGELLV